jgi:phosphatidylinositol kinase/protein kinase (PI-3  family)
MQFVFALLLLLLVSQSRRPVAAFSDNLSIVFSSTFIINYPSQTFLFSLCPINSINAIILFKVFMPLFFILLEPFLYSTYTKVYTSLKHHLIFYRCSSTEALG